MAIMKHFIIPFIVSLCLIGCGCPRNCPKQIEQRDSVAVHIVDSTVFRDSTIYVVIPLENESTMTGPSDTSHLETSLAVSDAWYDGMIHHTLRNKSGERLPVSIQVPEHIHSESGYHETIITNTIEVEKKLTKWQKFRMDIGGWTLAALVLLIAIFAYKYWKKL